MKNIFAYDYIVYVWCRCENKIEAMKQWCDFIANKTDSTTVYIGHMCNIKKVCILKCFNVLSIYCCIE